MTDRVRCADKDGKYSSGDLYRYAYINNRDCIYGFGVECELNFTSNKYRKLLDKSNPYSKTFEQDVHNCVKKNKDKEKQKIGSPVSVAEVEGVEETKENNDHNNIFDFRSLSLDERLGGKRNTIKRNNKHVI